MRFHIIWIISLKYEFCENWEIQYYFKSSDRNWNSSCLIIFLLLQFTKILKRLAALWFFTDIPKSFVKSRIGKTFGKITLSGPLQIKFNHNLDLKNGTHKKWHMLRLENSNKIRCVTAKLLFSMASMRERWRLIFAAKADDTHCMC